MEAQLKQIIQQQAEEIGNLKKELAARESRIIDLTSLLDKYQSVFSRQTHKMDLVSDGLGGNAVGDGEVDNVHQVQTRKRCFGISAEPEDAEQIVSHELKRHPKPEDVRKLIKQAIMENDFMNHLAQDQLNNLIDCMYPVSHKAGDTVIKEGDLGDVVYVLFDGRLEISKDGQKIREIGKCTVFGELAVLYNCERTATVKALTLCRLWAIDRKSFQAILRKKNIQRHKSRVAFLKSVPTFQTLPENLLSQMADQLTEVKYLPNEYVIRQGARGDNFYIVCEGQVNVTINETDELGVVDDMKPAHFVRSMGRGDWFGEKALKGDQRRTANIIAAEPSGVVCLALDYDSYSQLIGDLEVLDRQYADTLWSKKTKLSQARKEFENLQLSDLKVVGTLGVGGFGRVNLVQIDGDEKRSFALKQMKKNHIVQTRQQEHVMNERNILFQTSSDFIVRLWKTFKDRKYVYMLLEACLGGELWALLRDQYFFTENVTQFYIACVIEALDYLHKMDIAYRDLKPENLILDAHGYCKLTDFGFSKKIQNGMKTWTFCGTPEYMAPEIILNKGHDFAVDFWSLGILIFELLTGLPPFDTPDSMRTYSLILRGIDAIGFPAKVSKNAQYLIKKLCRDNPSERLGYGKGGIRETEKSVWFEGFNWIGLQRRTLQAPHIPAVQSPRDLSNFDEVPADHEIPCDELSGWDECF
ncbi:unnamed protein product [Calicophoron daubneyi]|uniref:cGMP-dependent protein kinase n=1 Tax=Calicophoron daubneyi TaxID=300641 RepID=A0AAV2T156_CALDB